MYKFAAAAFVTIACAASVQAQTPAAVAPAMKALIDRQFTAIDADRNGTISRAEFDRYAVARIALQDRDFEVAFKSLDADNDGKVSVTEAQANPPLSQNFAAVDTNRDQSISRPELHAAMIAAQSVSIEVN